MGGASTPGGACVSAQISQTGAVPSAGQARRVQDMNDGTVTGDDGPVVSRNCQGNRSHARGVLTGEGCKVQRGGIEEGGALAAVRQGCPVSGLDQLGGG